MILRKPYKFLIKNFRIIHLILAILSVYLVLKTNNILNFFNEYASTSSLISVKNISDQLFNSLMFVIPIIVIIGVSIMIYLLKWKEKPIKFYIFNLMIYIIIFVVYSYVYYVCKKLEIGVIDIRIIKAIDDIALVLFLIQTISFIFFTARSFGFNVKKFNFEADSEFQVEAEDNEEFEFDVNVDTNKTKRNIKRKIRNAKYVYKENKTFINIVFIVTIVIIGISLYLNYGVFNKTYKVGDNFSTSSLKVKIESAYLTNQKYNRNIITDNKLVVLKASAISKYLKENDLGVARFQLMIKNIPFNHTEKYSDSLLDLGTTYKNQNIDNTNSSEYLLVFEIPKQYSKEKMILVYNDANNKRIKIKINPKDLTKDGKVTEYGIGDTININNDIVKNVDLTILSYNIKDKQKVYYDFKTPDGEIYDSYEYLVPSYTDNYEKSLLSLIGNIKYKNENDIKNINLNEFFEFIKYFGSFEYTVNGENKIFNKTIKQVKPKKAKKSNEIFIEIPKEMENADSIILNINMRNTVYKYKIK